MADISGKRVILLMVLTIAISVAGTIINLHLIGFGPFREEITGRALSGFVEVQVLNFVAIDVTSADVDFGSGAVATALDLSTEQQNPDTFNTCIENLGEYDFEFECRGIQVENSGNVNVRVSMSSDQDGDSLMLGDNQTDEFRFAAAEGNLSRDIFDSCRTNGATGLSLFPQGSSYATGFMNWTNISKNFNYIICHNLTFTNLERSLVVEFNITLPQDEGNYSAGESRMAVLEFIAEQV